MYGLLTCATVISRTHTECQMNSIVTLDRDTHTRKDSSLHYNKKTILYQLISRVHVAHHITDNKRCW